MATAQKPNVDHWRDSYDYRGKYFEKNPGFLGAIWFCSQCAKPLLGKHKVEVDHGFPPSFFVREGKDMPLLFRPFFGKKKRDKHGNIIKNTSILAEAANRSFNLVACCKTCNRKKSDKVGIVTVKAMIAKVLETALFGVQSLVVVGISLGVKSAYFAISQILKLLAKPLKSKSPWYVKVMIVGVYAGLVWYGISRLQQ